MFRGYWCTALAIAVEKLCITGMRKHNVHHVSRFNIIRCKEWSKCAVFAKVIAAIWTSTVIQVR